MKFLAPLISAILLAACAAPGSSGDGAYRAGSASGNGDYNRDVRDAVTRGTTQGINPL